ncbi:MAG: hypothetical protein P4L80_07185 [Xanthobacteraceae bacterium]|nr:hypothetical protein [Xanthobacteraceae bacterium]
MLRLRVVMLAAVPVIGSTVMASAGPCTTQIAEVDRYIQRTKPGPASGPTAPQSIGAQLHHQPTPSSVESAENQARQAAAAALERARSADAAGDAAACRKALDQAKELYGLE